MIYQNLHMELNCQLSFGNQA